LPSPSDWVGTPKSLSTRPETPLAFGHRHKAAIDVEPYDAHDLAVTFLLRPGARGRHDKYGSRARSATGLVAGAVSFPLCAGSVAQSFGYH
jgi:hypothetical protein